MTCIQLLMHHILDVWVVYQVQQCPTQSTGSSFHPSHEDLSHGEDEMFVCEESFDGRVLLFSLLLCLQQRVCQISRILYSVGLHVLTINSPNQLVSFLLALFQCLD